MKEVIRFVADDGTLFESKESCEIYEKNSEEIIHLRFDKIPKFSQRYYDTDLSMFGGEDKVYAVVIKDEHDLRVVNAWIEFYEKKYGEEIQVLPDTAIGTVYMFSISDGYFIDLGTPERFKKKLCNIVDSFLVGLKGEKA